MTREEKNEWERKANSGLVKECFNPAFILSLTATALLTQIAKGEINLQELAKRELEDRGYGINGQLVGFNKVIE